MAVLIGSFLYEICRAIMRQTMIQPETKPRRCRFCVIAGDAGPFSGSLLSCGNPTNVTTPQCNTPHTRPNSRRVVYILAFTKL